LGADCALADAWSSSGAGAWAGVSNRLVPAVENASATDAANQVTAEFRLANWGLPPATFPAWTRIDDTIIPTPDPNPATPRNLNPGGQADLEFGWQLDATQLAE
jgi:hypothetical protein